MYPDIGRRIKEARIAKDITLKELGKLVGISESTVHKYEAGNIKGLKTDRLEKFAQILDVDAEWIMGWQDETPKKKFIEVTDFTDDEIKEISNYINYIIMKRDNNEKG